ncbi:MAG: hypothetical protein WKF95_01625 [Rubrobacter sp.]
MKAHGATCPLTRRQLIDEYFMEHRNQVLEVAAFLDRMDRSVDGEAGDDFRGVALRGSLRELCSEEPGRVERIQMLLSDTTTGLRIERDRQGAYGASDDEEVR